MAHMMARGTPVKSCGGDSKVPHWISNQLLAYKKAFETNNRCNRGIHGQGILF